MQHDSPVSLDAVTAQGNELGVEGATELRPALQKLPKLTRLYLYGTCGNVLRQSTQCGQCGWGRGRVGQAVVYCDGLFACEVRGVWAVR